MIGDRGRHTAEARLRCTRCGNLQSIRRLRGRLRRPGHLKRIWCIRCRQRTLHVELGARLRPTDSPDNEA